jgi:hypothetical protein
MADLTGMMQAAAGAAGGENLYIEDVFSTYLYDGTGSSTDDHQRDLDLDGEGGLVWIKKQKVSGSNHLLQDTERGIANVLYSNDTAALKQALITLTANIQMVLRLVAKWM